MSSKIPFIFGEVKKGISKTGSNYHFITLSDGFESFSVTPTPGLDLSDFNKGDAVECDFTVEVRYGKLSPVLKSINLAK